jgi:hypothetical protein
VQEAYKGAFLALITVERKREEGKEKRKERKETKGRERKRAKFSRNLALMQSQ